MPRKARTTTTDLPLITGLSLLKQRGATFVVINYSGSGDSGDIDAPQAYNITDHESILWDRDTPTVEMPDGLAEQIEAAITPRLDTLPDWWNNEGGGGRVVIDLADFSVKIYHYINVTTQEHSEHEVELS